ncbi:hypothetical protein CJP46_35295 [Paenibacillus sp. XY044]|nr:hypothetical protein CJP46_35295 [Paenibacillus sp. XY044]
MWNLIELLYEIIYYIIKNLNNWKWEVFLIYIFYLFGKRSGMKMVRKWMQSHFPVYFTDDNEEWRKWATENIESLGGSKWQSKKLSGPIRPLRKVARTSLNTSSKLLPEGTSPGDQSERMNRMKRLIVIDAGHGAKDPGAIGYSKKNQEKAFNLSVALKVNELLKNDTNLEVRLTRSTDVFLELKERSDFANKAKADAFISIHANSASTTATGTETHYTRADSKALAEVIHKHVLKATGLKDRGLHTGNLYVTKHTNMPAILLEPGFVSNPTEEAILFDGNFQTKLAQEIVSGLKEYFRVDTKAPTPSNTPYPEMTVTVDNQSFIGYNINNFTWIPSRPVGEMLGGTIDYVKGKVTINGNAVDTKLINGVGFVTARDLTDQLGARIYWEKSEPYNVIIYPKL